METGESINYRFRKSVKRNLNLIYPLILGVVMGYAGLVREYCQTGYIPIVHEWNENRLSTSNKIIGFTGIGIAFSSLSLQAGLNIRAKRRRDKELESLSNSAPEVDSGLPYSNP